MTTESGPVQPNSGTEHVKPPLTTTINAMLAAARQRLQRLTPHETADALAEGAVLIDIRPRDQRRHEGEVPGSLVIERNVLEWRLDPMNAARIPEATGYDRQVIIMCSQGYTSSLAAASLQGLGLRNATDLDGGFEQWAEAALPTMPGGRFPDA